MKMFRWGIEGGRPAPGSIGTAPEWFYKGTGTILRGHGEALDVPAYAGDGGEEAEIAGIYMIAPDGQPCRIGMAGGNEFSDHVFEKTNYLNLAASKLRTCALGPELVVDPDFESVPVEVKIERAGNLLWSKTFRSGEAEMCHSLANIEHHHFKYEAHRRPGDVHVHFFGTDCLSFSDGISLQDGDVMQVSVEGFGRPLRNPVRVAGTKPELISVKGSGVNHVKTACGNYRTGNYGKRDGRAPALRGLSSCCLQQKYGQGCALRQRGRDRRRFAARGRVQGGHHHQHGRG